MLSLFKSRSFLAALAAAGALVVALVVPATSAAAPPKVLLKDDFRQGLDLTSTWALLSFPPFFLADDGIVTTSNQGLYVKASGTNPDTGAPAFTKVSPGDFDHVKWMADTQHLSSNFYPGFDAVPGSELQCNMWARGQTFGTEAQPFGSAVTNPNTDLRLASFAMNTLDYETGMVFDVWMTNNAIYPYYERLNLTGSATYDAFSSVFPPVWRTPGDQVKVTVAYNRAAGVVRWLVNDREVARVSNIGFQAPGATTIIDHGGIQQAAAPRQLNCGMALFTLLDGGLPPTGNGLVNLAPPYTFPTTFVGGPNLFGQGAEMHVSRFEVDSASP
ncbi:MAG: DUF6081 family protein [Actinomycetota bacterium]|nr:DUF6081 family protein [Actinomycetota bacterium]